VLIAIPLAFRRTASPTPWKRPTVQPFKPDMDTPTVPFNFLNYEKQKTDPPSVPDFSEIRNAHLYRLGREIGAGIAT
jgi:hypothetical protein